MGMAIHQSEQNGIEVLLEKGILQFLRTVSVTIILGYPSLRCQI